MGIEEKVGGLAADFDFDLDSGGVGGTSESQDGTQLPEDKGEVRKYEKWGQIHTEILDAFLIDEENWEGDALKALAKRLRATVEELFEVYDSINPTEWSVKRLERLLENERVRNKDVNWDRLESATLGKLTQLVESNKNMKLGELLAVATAANRASRRTGGAPMPGHNVNVFMGGNQQGAEIALPGPSHLGTMKLTLTAKTVEQLGQGITIDHESDKLSEKVEMLGGDDIPAMNDLADKA